MGSVRLEDEAEAVADAQVVPERFLDALFRGGRVSAPVPAHYRDRSRNARPECLTHRPF